MVTFQYTTRCVLVHTIVVSTIDQEQYIHLNSHNTLTGITHICMHPHRNYYRYIYTQVMVCAESNNYAETIWCVCFTVWFTVLFMIIPYIVIISHVQYMLSRVPLSSPITLHEHGCMALK